VERSESGCSEMKVQSANLNWTELYLSGEKRIRAELHFSAKRRIGVLECEFELSEVVESREANQAELYFSGKRRIRALEDAAGSVV